MTEKPQTIAFIGLGTMGSGMAECLVRAGHTVRGFDLDGARVAALTEAGGTGCTSVADACNGADTVMTILPKDQHVEAVCLGEGGLRDSAARGTLVLEMSTVLPATSLRIGTAMREAGLRMMDAPVGRTPEDARRGTLLVMAGGARSDFDAAQSVFAAIADKTIHMGPAGSGISMKVANNYMSMVGMVMTAETLVLAKKAGIDTAAAVEVLQNTVAGRGQINVNYPKKVLSGDVTPDFPLMMGDKDISLGLSLGRDLGVPLFLGAPARELFGMAKAMEMETLDCTAMLLLIERLAGLPGALPTEGGTDDA